jgi:enamine deaminase RidA (YjgF/YER057c/UK114 family)
MATPEQRLTELGLELPDVVNGASDLLGEVFGDAGTHARSAVGVVSLPLDAPVEVELVVEVG